MEAKIKTTAAKDRGTHQFQLHQQQDSEHITTDPHKQVQGLDYYPMTSKKHGLCLILKLGKGKDFNCDEENLEQTWAYLGYHVEIRRYCTESELESIFTNIDDLLAKAAQESGVANDSFVCCILAHGKENQIQAYDKELINIEDIERDIGQSKLLHSDPGKPKPKLFIIDACRGENPGDEVAPTGVQMDDDETDSPIYYVSSRSDTNIFYATSLGDISRPVVTGSVFVRELCKILYQHATSHTLHQMQLLNARLPRVHTIEEKGRKFKQQPTFSSILTKYVHFFEAGTHN